MSRWAGNARRGLAPPEHTRIGLLFWLLVAVRQIRAEVSGLVALVLETPSMGEVLSLQTPSCPACLSTTVVLVRHRGENLPPKFVMKVVKVGFCLPTRSNPAAVYQAPALNKEGVPWWN
jgi:hypothetical protein